MGITIVYLSQLPATSMLYDKEISSEQLWQAIFVCIIQLMYLFFIHLIITQVGMIFVESEIVRIGNDQILDNLKEGVVILAEENDKVLFVNPAAKSLNVRVNENFCMSMVGAREPININARCFSQFDINNMKTGNDIELAQLQMNASQDPENLQTLNEIIKR